MTWNDVRRTLPPLTALTGMVDTRGECQPGCTRDPGHVEGEGIPVHGQQLLQAQDPQQQQHIQEQQQQQHTQEQSQPAETGLRPYYSQQNAIGHPVNSSHRPTHNHLPTLPLPVPTDTSNLSSTVAQHVRNDQINDVVKSYYKSDSHGGWIDQGADVHNRTPHYTAEGLYRYPTVGRSPIVMGGMAVSHVPYYAGAYPAHAKHGYLPTQSHSSRQTEADPTIYGFQYSKDAWGPEGGSMYVPTGTSMRASPSYSALPAERAPMHPRQSIPEFVERAGPIPARSYAADRNHPKMSYRESPLLSPRLNNSAKEVGSAGVISVPTSHMADAEYPSIRKTSPSTQRVPMQLLSYNPATSSSAQTSQVSQDKKIADLVLAEKRRRNANASARFRDRRKQRQIESDERILLLTKQVERLRDAAEGCSRLNELEQEIADLRVEKNAALEKVKDLEVEIQVLRNIIGSGNVQYRHQPSPDYQQSHNTARIPSDAKLVDGPPHHATAPESNPQDRDENPTKRKRSHSPPLDDTRLSRSRQDFSEESASDSADDTDANAEFELAENTPADSSDDLRHQVQRKTPSAANLANSISTEGQPSALITPPSSALSSSSATNSSLSSVPI